MTRLIECPGCTRHVRADDARCPFCERPSTTAAPSRMLVLMLPLTLMACTAESPAPASKPEASKPVSAKPAELEPKPKPEPVAPGGDGPAVVQPSKPADGGDAADPVVPSDDRVMATKYGGPPVMDDLGPKPVDSLDAPKPAAPRPAKKYGAPPKPSRDPLGGL